jgi:hypothetical protein
LSVLDPNFQLCPPILASFQALQLVSDDFEPNQQRQFGEGFDRDQQADRVE